MQALRPGLILARLIQDELDDNLGLLELGVLHDDLDGAALTAIIEEPHILTADDLLQAAIARIADFDKLAIDKEDVGVVHGGLLDLAEEVHDDATADFAVLADVDRALFVAEQELVFEAEHAQGFLGGHL